MRLKIQENLLTVYYVFLEMVTADIIYSEIILFIQCGNLISHRALDICRKFPNCTLLNFLYLNEYLLPCLIGMLWYCSHSWCTYISRKLSSLIFVVIVMTIQFFFCSSAANFLMSMFSTFP
jgi:hypothetical protein